MKASTAIVLATLLAFGPVAPLGAEGERELQAVNINYEGNNVWTPGTFVVKKGEKVRFKLYNRVKADPNVHGFAIDEFNVKVDVYRDKPETVEFVADKAGLFRIWCHLHPAHLPGQLLVLEK
ncbi:MAG TPA: cupredoxin domain-containing protein [Candidatus Methylomirabilis sp.]|nr:cupredoxin domain-containing protein [Candidatus Methylomirabilis sp.]